MTPTTLQSTKAWALARRQHWVITYGQLRDLGLSHDAIRHRRETGRLHEVWREVYAVARRDLTREGLWMAAVLACGDDACLAGDSSAQLWGMRAPRRRPIHVAVPPHRNPKPKGIRTHRRRLHDHEVTTRDGIPTTIPLLALIDLAAAPTSDAEVERAVGQADILGLTNPERLRRELETVGPRRGVRRMKRLLDRHTFVLTHTELERRFLAIVKRAGLPLPEGQRRYGKHRVDFFWPELKLVVETDGLTYHRTAAQQSEDLRRDHEHAAAGLRTLRFSHAQIRYEPEHVEATLAAVK